MCLSVPRVFSFCLFVFSLGQTSLTNIVYVYSHTSMMESNSKKEKKRKKKKKKKASCCYSGKNFGCSLVSHLLRLQTVVQGESEVTLPSRYLTIMALW